MKPLSESFTNSKRAKKITTNYQSKQLNKGITTKQSNQRQRKSRSISIENQLDYSTTRSSLQLIRIKSSKKSEPIQVKKVQKTIKTLQKKQ